MKMLVSSRTTTFPMQPVHVAFDDGSSMCLQMYKDVIVEARGCESAELFVNLEQLFEYSPKCFSIVSKREVNSFGHATENED